MATRHKLEIPGKRRRRFVRWYRHWKTGKLMVAEDYGYKAWPFG
jgi:hypothetical protein